MRIFSISGRRAGRLSIIAFLVSAAVAAGCAGSPVTAVTGSGRVVTQQRTVDPFAQVDVAGPVRVVVQDGGPTAVVVRADDNLAPLISTQSDGTTLRVRVADNTTVSTRNDMTVLVTIPSLETATGNGAVRFDLVDVTSPNLKISLQGASIVTGTGTADQLDLELEAASVAQLADLHVLNANVALRAASVANVTASGTVTGEAHQASVLTIHGGPSVDVATSELSVVNH